MSKERRQTSLDAMANRLPQFVNELWNSFLDNATICWAIGLEAPDTLSSSPATELAMQLRNELLTQLQLSDEQVTYLTLLSKSLENEREKLVRKP